MERGYFYFTVHTATGAIWSRLPLSFVYVPSVEEESADRYFILKRP